MRPEVDSTIHADASTDTPAGAPEQAVDLDSQDWPQFARAVLSNS